MRTSRGRGLKTLKVKERKRSEPGQKQDHTRKEPGPSKTTFRFLCANTFGEGEERGRGWRHRPAFSQMEGHPPAEVQKCDVHLPPRRAW